MSDQQQQSQNYIIPHDVAQALANYLATQPYGQVFRLVAALQNLKPAPPMAVTTSGPVVGSGPTAPQTPTVDDPQ